MGLYAEFSITGDMGFPDELTGGEGEQSASVLVNYSSACEIFVESFLRNANALVPVDTGYLKSTIDAGTDGDICWAEATADYAQYVEYGTIHMDPQPYFELALEIACAEAGIEAQEALDFAQEELEAILSAMMEASMSAFGGHFSPQGMGGMSFGSWLGGMATFALAFILFFPILVYAYGIMDTIGNALTGGGSYADIRGGGGGFGGGGFVPEVIIT